MNIWDIVKKVGTGIISNAPGGSLVLGAVNALLPDDKQLPTNATAEQLGDAVSSLPPEQRAEIMAKEFEVDITHIKESHSTVRAMLESDAKNPHSTRPYIAKHSFHILALVSAVIVSLWAYGIYTNKADLVKAVTDGWPFVLAVTMPFSVLLQAYFGVLKREHKNKLDAAGGHAAPSGVAGMISAVLRR